MALGCGCVPWTTMASGCLRDVLSAMGIYTHVCACIRHSLLLDSLKMGAHGKGQTRGRYTDAHRLMCVPVGALGKGQITSHRKHLRLPDRVITAQGWPSSARPSCGCRKWVPLNSTISSLAELGGWGITGDCTKACGGTNLGALSSCLGNLGSRFKHSGSEE